MLSYSFENFGNVLADFLGTGNWIAAKTKDEEVLEEARGKRSELGLRQLSEKTSNSFEAKRLNWGWDNFWKKT